MTRPLVVLLLFFASDARAFEGGGTGYAIDPGEVNGALSREDASAALARRTLALRRCGEYREGPIAVLDVTPLGRVRSATLLDATSSTDERRFQSCLLRVVRRLRFPVRTAPSRITLVGRLIFYE